MQNFSGLVIWFAATMKQLRTHIKTQEDWLNNIWWINKGPGLWIVSKYEELIDEMNFTWAAASRINKTKAQRLIVVYCFMRLKAPVLESY